MAETLNDLSPQQALVEIARDFHQRGWMAGTAGNLSARNPATLTDFWITASGLPKGRLQKKDFLRINIADGAILDPHASSAKPSAETSIHRVIYQGFPEVMACLHVHTVDACVVTSRLSPRADQISLPELEMIKGLDIWDENPDVSIPVFDNLREVAAIAANIETRFEKTPPRTPALMIRNHGMTVWGRSLQEAYNRLEIVEFLMSYIARQPG